MPVCVELMCGTWVIGVVCVLTQIVVSVIAGVTFVAGVPRIVSVKNNMYVYIIKDNEISIGNGYNWECVTHKSMHIHNNITT